MANLPRPPTGDAVSGDSGAVSDAWNRWFNQIQLILNSSLVNAPSVAPYIIQTTNALLSNAQVLANLQTGFVTVNHGTGILSSQAQINSTDINPAGGTGTGLVVFQTSPTINNPTLTTPSLGNPVSGNLTNCTTGTPGSDTAIANKAYVDDKFGNIVVDYTTLSTDIYTVTYAGTGGIGDTMTFTTTGVKTCDGVNIALNKRLLIAFQADTTQNGVYLVTTAPAVGVAGILTRATNYDTAVKINAINLIQTILGTSNVGKSYTLDNPIVTIGPSGSAFTYTLAAPYVPAPTSTTLGGVLSISATSHKWINSISTLGSPTLTQPAFTDISGTATAAQLPAITTPTVQKFTSSSGNYTTPAGVAWIRLVMVGGGGGGGGGGSGSPGTGGTGGDTTFGTSLHKAGGGLGGVPNSSGGAGGTFTIGTGGAGIGATGSDGGVCPANSSGAFIVFSNGGGASALGGAGQGGGGASGSNPAVSPTTGKTNTGGGGGGGASAGNAFGGSGGGSGGFLDIVLAPTASQVFAYAVGAAGSAGTVGGGTSPQAGAAGGSGVIVVYEHYI